MDFAIRLKELREQKGVTQAELAQALGVGTSTIGMWESTKRTPSAKTLNKLLKYFNCSIDYLLGSENHEQKIIPYFSPTISPLTIEEEQLIADYRSLTPALQNMIKETIKTWKKSDLNKKAKGEIS